MQTTMTNLLQRLLVLLLAQVALHGNMLLYPRFWLRRLVFVTALADSTMRQTMSIRPLVFFDRLVPIATHHSLYGACTPS